MGDVERLIDEFVSFCGNPFVAGQSKAKRRAEDFCKRDTDGLNGLLSQCIHFLEKNVRDDHNRQLTGLVAGYGMAATLAGQNSWESQLTRKLNIEHRALINNVKVAIASHVKVCNLFKDKVIGVNDLHREIWHACFGEDLTKCILSCDVLRSINVLITGETGTGKEMVWEALRCASLFYEEHPGEATGADRLLKYSQNSHAINVAALTEGLLESDLFGHEKGAFTGADKTKDGLAQTSNNASLFLDEIGDMPLHQQTKILRMIESSTVRKVGSTKTEKIKVRYVTATHQDLAAKVADNTFREDLLYRINGVEIKTTPLRDIDKDNILKIASTFIPENQRDEFNPSFSKVIERLGDYKWPGNMRELRNLAIRHHVLGASKASSKPTIANHDSAKSIPIPTLIREATATLDDVRIWYGNYIANNFSTNEAVQILGVSQASVYKYKKMITGCNNEL